MMKQRLLLAKDLLKNDGVIFISIDDTEHAYLKVLMDEIFGEENFITNFNWQKKNEGSGDDSKFIKGIMEYVLMYAKNINYLKINKFKRNVDDGSYNLKDEYFERRGLYKLKQLDMASLTWSETLDSELIIDDQVFYAGGSTKEEWLERKNNHAIKDWRWRWSQEKIKWGLKNGYVIVKNNKVYSKQYQFVDNEDNLIERESPYSNLLVNTEVSGERGTTLLKNIFTIKTFDHPKPIELINFLINLHPNKNAIVLDFFAGSGTTGHSVMQMNKEDGGNRKFILCTNNENNIAYNITYERLYRIINGIGTKGESFNWIKENLPYSNEKLRVIKIDDSQKIDLNDLDTNKDFEDIINNALNGIKLLDNNYDKNKNLLDIYYDLAALNPLDNE